MSLALSTCGALLQAFGIPSLTEVMVGFGRAFGPDGCLHYSELSASEQAEFLARTPVVRTLHADWPRGFKWVPRTLTAYVTPNGVAPAIIYGTGTIEDIPEPGTYVATRGYVAITTRSRWHLRLGFRWDRSDQYLEFPAFTAKKLK